MKKILLLVFISLFVPVLVSAQNSLDEAHNLRGSLKNPDGSAGYLQDRYLGASDSGGGSGAPSDRNNRHDRRISGNNPDRTSGVSIDEVARANAGQSDDVRELWQAEEDLKTERENSIISYCMTVLAAYFAAIILMNIITAINPVAGAIFAAAVLVALIAAITIGFSKISETFPDGINPSGTVKTVCSVMLGALIVNEMIGFVAGPVGAVLSLIVYLTAAFSMIKGGNMLAREMVSGAQAPHETAEEIMERANKYKGNSGDKQ